jgi:hypothetical protein
MDVPQSDVELAYKYCFAGYAGVLENCIKEMGKEKK